MGKFVTGLKAYFCKHEFRTITVYDRDTVKSYCPKCGQKYVINTAYKWKFRLDDVSEKDYEDLRKEIERFQGNYEADERQP